MEGHYLLFSSTKTIFTTRTFFQQFNYTKMAPRHHEKFVSDSDSDSAISSEGTRDSDCTCDSCMCEDFSFSSCDSTLGPLSSPSNPFGSFKHTGALPYSMFEDSSSFSCSRVNNTEISAAESSDCTLQNSTHIYMNLMNCTYSNQMKSTCFWIDSLGETLNMASRPDCEGKEDPAQLLDDTITELACHFHDADSKVGPWLQSCTFSESTNDEELTDEAQPIDMTISAEGDISADSDATAFFEQSLVRHPVTRTLSTKRRHCLVQKFKELGRLLVRHRLGKKKSLPAV